LSVNHATVARQLTALEQELKTKLVEPRTTGCVLTSAGEALVAAAERAESEFRQVGAHLAGRRKQSQARFASALPMDWGNTFLPASLARSPRDIPTCSFN
jgi:DNA-binding transcriptional LysR family regulator